MAAAVSHLHYQVYISHHLTERTSQIPVKHHNWKNENDPTLADKGKKTFHFWKLSFLSLH